LQRARPATYGLEWDAVIISCPSLRTCLIHLSALLCLWASAAGAAAASAQGVFRVDGGGAAWVTGVEVLEDPAGTLTLEDVRTRNAQFRPLQSAVLPPGNSAWWLRLRLARGPAAPGDWVLVAGIPTLLSLDFHVPDGDSYRVYHAGSSVPQSHRPLPSWEPRFPLRLESTPETFYLRVHDPAELVVPLQLLDAETLAQRDRDRAIVMSLFLGLMLGLLVYNLFLFLSLRDPAYGWYVASGTALLLCFLMMTGWGSLHLWPEAAGFEAVSRLFLPALWGVAYWQFISRFFTLEDEHPRLQMLLQVFTALFVVATLWSLTGERYYGTRALHVLAIIALPWVFVIAVRRWLDGFRPAAVLLAGQFALVLPVFLIALRVSGVIGASPLVDNGLLLGAAAETLFFALALAQRIRTAETARDAALGLLLEERQARLEQVEAHNVELEQKVSERTSQLQAANSDLEAQKRRLAEEASQDNLTGLANRRALAERFKMLNGLSQRSDARNALLLIDLDGFKYVNDSSGHDAGDAVLKTLAERLQALVRVGDTLARIGGDEFVVLMAQNATETEARSFARRLVEAICDPVEFEGKSHRLGASIGIALSIPGQDTLSELMRRADQAMYEAKRGDLEPRILMAAGS
jgi:diguanylate cyclase (GGDEF)-like protein